LFLVGDNAFQGVSHLSQERSRDRVSAITNTGYCADLIITAIENGADGFMFTANENTLAILREIKAKAAYKPRTLSLYAIVPSAVNYVRLSGQKGMEGLAKHTAKQIIASGNLQAVASCLKGLAKTDIEPLLIGLLATEISKIKSSAGKMAKLESILMHELLTDIALSINARWIFDCFIKLVEELKITPGFETRNFSLLVRRLAEWAVDVKKVLIVAPFNKVGFQMSPSKEDNEEVIINHPEANVFGIRVS
jgi:hypothetical protein